MCFYKTSSMIHPLESDETEEMYVRIADDHNCDTFYFAFVRFAKATAELFKNLFRL